MIYFGQHAHLSRFPEPPSKKIIVGQNRCLVCISYYPKDTQTTLNVQTGKLMCPTPRMVRGIFLRHTISCFINSQSRICYLVFTSVARQNCENTEQSTVDRDH